VFFVCGFLKKLHVVTGVGRARCALWN